MPTLGRRGEKTHREKLTLHSKEGPGRAFGQQREPILMKKPVHGREGMQSFAWAVISGRTRKRGRLGKKNKKKLNRAKEK